jgi:hypothetical protein
MRDLLRDGQTFYLVLVLLCRNPSVPTSLI